MTKAAWLKSSRVASWLLHNSWRAARKDCLQQQPSSTGCGVEQGGVGMGWQQQIMGVVWPGQGLGQGLQVLQVLQVQLPLEQPELCWAANSSAVTDPFQD